MKISKEEVLHVAKLARLELAPEEAERFTDQLGRILEYFEKLQELNTEGVAPTRHAVPLESAFREDEPGESYDQDKAFQNAPDREGPFFRVPKIIE